jgi:hypothetical protein
VRGRLYCYIETVDATEARVLTALVLLSLLSAASWALGAFGGRALRRKAAAFGTRVGLPEAGRDPVFVARVGRRQRIVLAGVALGVLAAALTGGSVVLIWAGLAVGALADQLAAPVAPPGAPRVAHPTDTRLTDYVPAWLLWAVAAAAGCAPLLALLWSVAPRRPVPPASADTSALEVGGLVAVAAVGWAGSLLLARFLVGRPQRAASASDLVTDDAFRAQAVRDALQLTAALSYAAAFGLATALQDDDVTGLARDVGGWTPVVLLVAVAVVGTVHELTGGPRHWRRLHPARQPA